MRLARRVVQFAFVALTLVGVFVVRGNAERWCPFGGVEAAYTYYREGNLLCSLGVSNFYVAGAVLAAALVLRRAFCGYACPIGAISEWLQRAARRLGLRPAAVPYRVDRALSLLKYGALAVILFATYRAGELLFRGFDPCYALVSRHGEDITYWAYVVAGGIVVASLFVMMPFCRWLCPMAAVFHPFSRFALTRIKRNDTTCSGCGKCARACPMAIPVDQVRQVTAARCLSCMECIEVCPATARGALTWGPPGPPARRWPQGVVVGGLLACLGGAVAAAWAIPIASFYHERGTRPSRTASVELRVSGLTCRGSAALFEFFLDRRDEFEIPGYLRIEAWPAPDIGRARITFDPEQTDEEAIKRAITEAHYNPADDRWRTSPFSIVGYDPLGLDLPEAPPVEPGASSRPG